MSVSAISGVAANFEPSETQSPAQLICGDALKAAALKFLAETRARVDHEQGGLLSVFDSWFVRLLGQLSKLDADRSWEQNVRDAVTRSAHECSDLQWDLLRLKLFLDRREQGRFVEYGRREQSGAHYFPRFGTEFGTDVLLTCQGAPSLMRWRGKPLMKNVFDFAMYPALLAELRPHTIFEIGSGTGASAAWFADLLTLGGIHGQIHSVDIADVSMQHPNVTFHRGDCASPGSLFPAELLGAAPHPWLVIEDAHHNVSEVLDFLHHFMTAGDYLVIEDSDVKREVIRTFTAAHPGDYLVDTQFTDNFGRNATCAADSIFKRTGHAGDVSAQPSNSNQPVSKNAAGEVAIPLGDPAPWFSGAVLGEGQFNLQVAAGRWIVLAFLDGAQPGVLEDAVAELIRSAQFDDDHVIFCGVLAEPCRHPERLLKLGSPAVTFVTDYDGTIGRQFGAVGQPRTFVLDPMLRVVANMPCDGAAHFGAVRDVVKSLPKVDDSAGVPLTAPVLTVPRVLDFPLCDTLMRVFDEIGGEDSGFLLDTNGKTGTVIDHRLKRRRDLVIVHPVLREAMRSQIVRRLLPALDRFFQFKATRLDRYIVSCYDAATGGHFYRHRDNENIGAQHRRFAITINLNKDYDGGDLTFPEFGRRTYRAPVGGAILFACGALHQVTPVTSGRRYACLAFLYDEAGAALRKANNARLHPDAARYVEGSDLLAMAGKAESNSG
jgi:cephalosporin hydroxylase